MFGAFAGLDESAPLDRAKGHLGGLLCSRPVIDACANTEQMPGGGGRTNRLTECRAIQCLVGRTGGYRGANGNDERDI
jgi:hypothetical protein